LVWRGEVRCTWVLGVDIIKMKSKHKYDESGNFHERTTLYATAAMFMDVYVSCGVRDQNIPKTPEKVHLADSIATYFAGQCQAVEDVVEDV